MFDQLRVEDVVIPRPTTSGHEMVAHEQALAGFAGERMDTIGFGVTIELDVSNLNRIVELRCSRNQLTKLNVSNLTKLRELHCSVNQLDELDVSNLIQLEKLYCYENKLANLDVSKLNNLQLINYDINETNLVKNQEQDF